MRYLVLYWSEDYDGHGSDNWMIYSYHTNRKEARRSHKECKKHFDNTKLLITKEILHV